MKLWGGALGVLVVLGLQPPGATEPLTGTPVAEFRKVTVEPRAQGLAVTLHTSEPVNYAVSLLDAPTRLVIDLEATTHAWRKTPLAVNAEPLKEIRSSQFRKGVTRVVLHLFREAAYRIEKGEPESLIRVTFDNSTPAGDLNHLSSRSATRGVQDAAPGDLNPKRSPVPARSQLMRAHPPQIAQVAPGSPPSPRAGPPPISLDFKDADIANVLRILAAESGKNIVAGDDVKGKISLSLKNVPWELALETILETRGLQKIEKDNVIRIVSTEQLAREREARAKAEEAKIKAEAEIRAKIAEAQLKEQEVQQRKLAAEAAIKEAQARGALKEETIRLSYADPEEVAKTLQGILGIPPEGIQAGATPVTPGPPPIAEQPFAALFGPAAQQPPKAAPVSPSQEVLAKGITIRAHKPTNAIFIRHYEADLERIKTLIREKLDVPLPQVKIEARMDILDRNALEQIGIQWGGAGAMTESERRWTVVGQGFTPRTGTGIATLPSTPIRFNPNLTLSELLPVSAVTGLPLGGNLVNLPTTNLPTGGASPAGGFNFGIVGAKLNINLVLQALETQGKTRTLARPEIITVENNEATVSLGEEIPYATLSSAGTQIQFKEALLKLTVKPTVIREAEGNKIKMKVIVENNSRGDPVNLGSAGAPPAINKRRAETEVLIKEGERLVIGGVTTNVAVNTLRMVPLLGRIPIIGWLFKSREFSETGRELVVFVTPSVVRGTQPEAATQR